MIAVYHLRNVNERNRFTDYINRKKQKQKQKQKQQNNKKNPEARLGSRKVVERYIFFLWN